ncbi:hypothetical protein [Lactobacillus delbrueckii]|uniref:hypothetical protein n=1 Tax=Lactobacillus delbrueckii TaxID=1584 RepID=UPI00355BB6D8
MRIEGSFYALISFLFMFYGYFRAIDEPMISVVLTIFSLGTRVLLAYLLSAIPSIGYIGIWASIPIGWALADLAGLYYLHKKAAKPTDCFFDNSEILLIILGVKYAYCFYYYFHHWPAFSHRLPGLTGQYQKAFDRRNRY